MKSLMNSVEVAYRRLKNMADHEMTPKVIATDLHLLLTEFDRLKNERDKLVALLKLSKMLMNTAVKQRDEAVSVLRELARTRPLYCVCCGADTWDNHTPDCRLVKLLKEVER